jgi:hypothetical protein
VSSPMHPQNTDAKTGEHGVKAQRRQRGARNH